MCGCKVVPALMPTCLRRGDPDDVVGQCCSFSHAVPNVVHSAVPLNVGVGCHAIDVDVVAHVNLHKNCKEKLRHFKGGVYGHTHSDPVLLMYLLQCLQSIWVYFSDVVCFSYGIKVLTNRIDVHQAVVCDLNTLKVGKESAHRHR